MTKEELKERVKKCCNLVDSQYDMLCVFHLNEDKQIKLTDHKDIQTCRFCGKTESETSFKKVAHAISHMVENRHLKSEYECDECNELFATYESDYAAYMNIYHTLFRVHGKRGIPKFKNHSQQNSKISVENDVIKINIMDGEHPIIEWDEEDKKNFSFKIRAKRTYTPCNVLKALVKMAISIIPESELPYVQETINWLLNKPVSGCVYGMLMRIYRMPLNFTSCFILKKKDNLKINVPNYIFVLAYKNFIIQVPIPFIEEDKKLKESQFSMPLFPSPLDDFQSPFAQEYIKLTGNEKIKGEEITIGMKYGSMEEICLNNTKTEEE